MLFDVFADEQRAEGKYIKIVEAIRSWSIGAGETDSAFLARILHISLTTFNNVLALIKEHPDWTAEQIAAEVEE